MSGFFLLAVFFLACSAYWWQDVRHMKRSEAYLEEQPTYLTLIPPSPSHVNRSKS